MHKQTKFFAAFILVAASAGAQTIVVSAEQARAEEALESACGGWHSSAMRASLEGHLMRIDDAHAAQVNCVLKALSAADVSNVEAAFDQSYVNLQLRLLLDAYAPSAYDYFANQLDAYPGRVQRALVSALLDVGEPKATRMYFEARRAQAQPVSPETPRYYRAMLKENRCVLARCSPRLSESLAIVRANLDIAETELRAALMLTAPEGASAGELHHIAAVHREAQEMIDAVHRLR